MNGGGDDGLGVYPIMGLSPREAGVNDVNGSAVDFRRDFPIWEESTVAVIVDDGGKGGGGGSGCGIGCGCHLVGWAGVVHRPRCIYRTSRIISQEKISIP